MFWKVNKHNELYDSITYMNILVLYELIGFFCIDILGINLVKPHMDMQNSTEAWDMSGSLAWHRIRCPGCWEAQGFLADHLVTYAAGLPLD